MEKRQINFLNMTDSVSTGFNANEAIWSDKKPIVDAIGKMVAYRTEVDGLAYDQTEAKTTGETQQLKNAMQSMMGMAYKVIIKIRPYAIVTKQQKLLADIDYSISDLQRLKQMDCINTCKIVYQRGKENQAQMNGYDLTDAELEALAAAINGTAMLSGNRDAILGASKTATEGIPVCIEKIRMQLVMLDDLVPALIDDEGFVSNYQNNRRIIDR